MSHPNVDPILSIFEINETVLSIKTAAKIKSTGPSSIFPKIERLISFNVVFDLDDLKNIFCDDHRDKNGLTVIVKPAVVILFRCLYQEVVNFHRHSF